MLLYAWDLAAWRGQFKGAVEDSPQLLGLLGRVLVEASEPLLRRQLGRQHRERQESIRGIRGRIDFGQSLKRLEFESGRATCTFSELDVDTPRNRILRATLERLVHEPRLRGVEAAAKVEDLRHRLRSAVRRMDGVSSVRLSPIDFTRLALGRNDNDYRLPLAICELIFSLRLPTQLVGDAVLASLLSDEMRFSSLFESFVRNFYRHHYSVELTVQRERLSWGDQLNNPFVPSMNTDISMEEKNPPNRRLIIDAKYYAKTLDQGPFGGPKFKADNLYQMYAYLRTQEDRGPRFRDAEGMLLYPTTQQELDEAMEVQGHRIRIATVNLGANWESIEARLHELVSGWRAGS
jgi:5-methylcytosine-specific restriction enzyme subunit McrC